MGKCICIQCKCTETLCRGEHGHIVTHDETSGEQIKLTFVSMLCKPEIFVAGHKIFLKKQQKQTNKYSAIGTFFVPAITCPCQDFYK